MRIRKGLLFLSALAYMGLIFYLSSLPDLVAPLQFSYGDKVLHLGEYGILSTLLMLAGLPPWPAFAISAVYGATDELHQRFVPGRDGNGWDWAADAAGAFLASAMLFLWKRRRS
jgi:VanZ family protein